MQESNTPPKTTSYRRMIQLKDVELWRRAVTEAPYPLEHTVPDLMLS